jgi:small GTP-binding protein
LIRKKQSTNRGHVIEAFASNSADWTSGRVTVVVTLVQIIVVLQRLRLAGEHGHVELNSKFEQRFFKFFMKFFPRSHEICLIEIEVQITRLTPSTMASILAAKTLPLRTFTNVYKLLVVGSSACGKNSFVHALLGIGAPSAHVPTIGTELFQLERSVHDEPAELRIWNCPGHARFRVIIEQMLDKSIDGCFVLFDVSSAASFQEAQDWYQQISHQCPEAAIVLVANKSDCNTEIGPDQIEEARLDHLPLVFTTATLDRHVDVALNMMLQQLPAKA